MRKGMLAIAVALAGCVGTSDIVPMGKDSYIVSGHARGGMNQGEGAIAATKSANAYCAKQNKLMVPRHAEQSGNAAWGGEADQLIFSCVNASDPEYQRPNMQADPTAVIQDQRH